MIIFLLGNEIVGHYPPEDLTEDMKENILAEYPNAVWIDEEITYPDNTKSYKIYYIDGKLVYEEIEEPKQEPSCEERIAELEAEVDDLTEYQAELLFELSLMQLGLTNDDL